VNSRCDVSTIDPFTDFAAESGKIVMAGPEKSNESHGANSIPNKQFTWATCFDRGQGFAQSRRSKQVMSPLHQRRGDSIGPKTYRISEED
jgi:hypothetical protein